MKQLLYLDDICHTRVLMRQNVRCHNKYVPWQCTARLQPHPVTTQHLKFTIHTLAGHTAQYKSN